MVDQAGPFVHIATFCRDVVEQADGAVTLVGVTRRIELEVDDDDGAVADLMLYIGVRGGDVVGKHEIEIRPLTPDGDLVFEPALLPVVFDGGVSGAEIQMRLVFEAAQEGNYWFDLRLDAERLLTRIPLTVRFGRASTESAGETSTI